MPEMNSWYVFTGAPSSGKTTLLLELKKLGYKIVPEMARTVIDQAVTKGTTSEVLRKDEKQFQYTVMRRKVGLEASLSKSELTFFDRGLHDTMAYLQYYNYEIEKWIRQACQASSYRKVFLLEPLPVFEKDYSRIEDGTFLRHISVLLGQVYEAAGIPVVTLPPTPVKERLERVLEEIEVGAIV